jgi:hypothetical protein
MASAEMIAVQIFYQLRIKTSSRMAAEELYLLYEGVGKKYFSKFPNIKIAI